jgi:hypothetical protein
MKYIKMLGIAAVAAMSLMAFAGSASATELFSGATTLKAPVAIKASLQTGATANLTDTAGNPIDTCSGSEVTGSTTATQAATLSGAATVAWSGCTQVTKTLKGGTLTISHIAATTNGTVTSDAAEVTISVFGVSCVYGTGAGKDLGTLVGSTTKTATLNINVIVNEVGSQFLCPDTAKWVANYQVTSPDPLHVEA